MSNQAWESAKESIIRPLMVPVHADSWPLIAGAAALSVVLSFFSTFLGLMGLAATAALYGVSRDTKRAVPVRPGIIIAPCDGIVTHIEKYIGLPLDLDRAASVEETYTRLSISISLFDAHMHRMPVGGTIRQALSMPGAVRDESAAAISTNTLDENPRALILIADDAANEYALCQIMGRVFHHAENLAAEGDRLLAGDRLGMVRFARRVDLYLPGDWPLAAAIGQRVIAGETILADRAQTHGDAEIRIV